MEIQGPFTIAVNDNNETGLRELHLGFKPAFQQLDLSSRLNMLQDYIKDLQKDIDTETDVKSQQGMITIMQISQELTPHLEADEIPLEETIVVDIGPLQTSPLDDLLRGATIK
ncbi:MAG: transcriptional regulator [Gammaproteobacteria bacterium]|nr:transcriptional regulator [Gammaproteobacteria bacterium]